VDSSTLPSKTSEVLQRDKEKIHQGKGKSKATKASGNTTGRALFDPRCCKPCSVQLFPRAFLAFLCPLNIKKNTVKLK
jgi:hypothetical protein